MSASSLPRLDLLPPSEPDQCNTKQSVQKQSLPEPEPEPPCKRNPSSSPCRKSRFQRSSRQHTPRDLRNQLRRLNLMDRTRRKRSSCLAVRLRHRKVPTTRTWLKPQQKHQPLLSQELQCNYQVPSAIQTGVQTPGSILLPSGKYQLISVLFVRAVSLVVWSRARQLTACLN